MTLLSCVDQSVIKNNYFHTNARSSWFSPTSIHHKFLYNTLHTHIPSSIRTRHAPQVHSTSWGGETPDWDLEPYTSDEETEQDIQNELFPPEGKDEGPQFVVQNALALVLLGSLALASINVLLKLGTIAFALVSAAFRYTVVGIFVLILLVLF